MISKDKAQEQLGDFVGKTVTIRIDEKLGSAWSHEPNCETPIRFYEDLDFLTDTVIEYYQDYLTEAGGFVDDDLNWIHPSIFPFASVGGSAEADDDEFFSESFAFLFWDLAKGTIVSATTDDWDFKTIGTINTLRESMVESE